MLLLLVVETSKEIISWGKDTVSSTNEKTLRDSDGTDNPQKQLLNMK